MNMLLSQSQRDGHTSAAAPSSTNLLLARDGLYFSEYERKVLVAYRLDTSLTSQGKWAVPQLPFALGWTMVLQHSTDLEAPASPTGIHSGAMYSRQHVR